MAITAYLFYEDVAGAQKFLAKAFGFKKYGASMRGEDGKLNHAAMSLGDDFVMMGYPGPQYKNPKRLGQATQNLYVNVDDVDQHFVRARKAGATVELVVIPTLSNAADRIRAREVRIGDLHSIISEYDAIISNSHAEGTASRLGIPLYEMGFPVYKTFGYTSKVTVGYRGTLAMISEMANLLMKKH